MPFATHCRGANVAPWGYGRLTGASLTSRCDPAVAAYCSNGFFRVGSGRIRNGTTLHRPDAPRFNIQSLARMLPASRMEVLVSMTALAAHASECDSAHIWVSICDGGGWDISVEIGGHTVMREHCGDWHRVERRRAGLRAQLAKGQLKADKLEAW